MFPFLALAVVLAAGPAVAEPALRPGDRILFYGNSLLERLHEDGRLEAWVQLAHPAAGLTFRSLAWSGDEVGHRLRPERYTRHLRYLLDQWPADVVVVAVGMNESFAGSEGLDTFREDLTTYLEELGRRHPDARGVLCSPTAWEELPDPNLPRAAGRNADIESYAAVLEEVAGERGWRWLDLFTPTRNALADPGTTLTGNGFHPSAEGLAVFARLFAREWLGEEALAGIAPGRVEAIAAVARLKAGPVATLARPLNAAVYYGVRARPHEYEAEMPRYLAMIDHYERILRERLSDAGQDAESVPPPDLPPLEPAAAGDARHAAGTILAPDEQRAEFATAPGYSVSLFASEAQFPELRNPVQVAFDERGRLWVVTMPSFPHTVPGEAPDDRILVLEDRDRDGRADRCTTFAGGLNVPDGIVFHEDGVIVSHQPRLLFMRDTDGDGAADEEREMLRGIDVTDSHHGGMIALDPMGDVLFCDGVFHRSQIETPFGVTRGVDATTYRLHLPGGRVSREYQTTTPNPWKITWDAWGNLYQMYGDGFVQDSAAIPWSPFGIYHPFARGIIIRYGKGSGVETISSPHFPDRYQQGLASATLLGRYFVALSALDRSGALGRPVDRIDVLSSENAAFRPVDMAFGFDGALYVSDFCSAIIGHAQHDMRDPRWDHDHGRIWRLTCDDRPLVTDWPRIAGVGPDALLALLAYPQNNVRDHARRRLRRLADLPERLDRWMRELPAEAATREPLVLEALWLFQSRGRVRPALLEELLASEDARMRAAAVHLVRFQADSLPEPRTLLARMAADPHPRVRLEVIHAVSHLQQRHPEWTALYGAIRTDDAEDLAVAVADASHGVQPARGREIPVLSVAPETLVTAWLRRPLDGSAPESIHTMTRDTDRGGRGSTLRTVVRAEAPRQAVLALQTGYVNVALNGTPVFAAEAWFSSDWKIPLDLREGLNEIRVTFPAEKRSPGIVPIHLFDPLGRVLSGVEIPTRAETLRSLAAAYAEARGDREGTLRITALPNQLLFSPAELRAEAGRAYTLEFRNPDAAVHNWVLVAPGQAERVGLAADRLALQDDAGEREYVPALDSVLWSTPLVDGGGSHRAAFTAPERPGRYPFLCTFPGHWRVMQGVLVVE